ncbi:MAG: hypothetical protein IIA83_00065 [Thaumarchaeota archaeon]|nr:hypothetical protein [Nitrososphaerota archaeon]
MSGVLTIRKILQDEIQKEVVGPHEIDEVFKNSDSPKSRYLSGVLYPIQTPVLDDDFQNSGAGIRDHDGGEDSEKVPINVGTKPSSMGLTCNLLKSQKSVVANISYGRYLPPQQSTSTKEDKTSKKINNTEKEKYPDWQRIDHKFDPITIDTSKKSDKIELEPNIFFRYFINENKEFDYFSLSVFVTNESSVHGDDYVDDSQCVFQPTIKLTSSNSSKIFLNISKILPKKINQINPDDRITAFLFRNFKHFAAGRNCSVEWNPEEQTSMTSWVQTTFTPNFIIREIKPRSPSNEIEKSLSMRLLSEIHDYSKYSDILMPIIDDYKKWIDDLINRKNKWIESESDYEKNFISIIDVPQKQIDDCIEALDRIKEGMQIISSNPLIGESFRFANEAMYLNRSYTVWAKENRDKIAKGEQISESGPNFDSQKEPTWRLFQLAFLLLTIESLSNPNSRNRKTVDLLWFPTGGGKTEAYYGVIAFILAHRRLKGSNFNKQNGIQSPKLEEELDRYGVTVIMRYTYRLLTLQQFQRAVTLFCAFEYIRLKNSDNVKKFGSEPFLVGLWVGHDTTPNNFDEAKKLIQQKRNNSNFIIDRTDPIQLLNCPWCGRKLNAHNYEFEQNYQSLEKLKPKRIRIRCSNKCFFGKPLDSDRVLPVVFVDDDIRNLRPSLLIATVDKFAQISWNWKYSTLFGNVSQYCKEHGYNPGNMSTTSKDRCNHIKKHKFSNGQEEIFPTININRKLSPPELIIQDELHLIAGPLGTLTGLYETAIEILCTNEQNNTPKIIASTATTKKSDIQIKYLFNSDMTKIFPPQGFEFGDSYFAQVLPLSDDHPGKLHVGVCSTSVSGPNVDSRIASCMLRKIRHIRENKAKYHFDGKNYKFEDDEIDSYFTLVSYYNTIKNLGSAMRMYEDTVPNYMDTIINTSENRFQKENSAIKKSVKILQKTELTGRINAANIPQILHRMEIKLPDKEVLDALLCTNMLSVGVDVDRINVMVINGQPKSTSEYIQATGRIGRKDPGIVVTNYTYIRPRDLSYFENFNQFHSTYHKSVEPGTLTPFAGRARDRGLAGVFFALVRLNSKTISEDPKMFTRTKQIDEIKKKILKRVALLEPKEEEYTAQDIEKIIEKWELAVSQYRNWSEESTSDLRYRRNPVTNVTKPGVTYLLNSSRDTFNENTFVIPESLREAESEIRLYYSKQFTEDE